MYRYKIFTTTKFDKDYKKIKKRGYNIELLKKVVDILAQGEELPRVYKDHDLIGNFQGYRECHILNDWLLIYKIEKENLFLILSRTGTHSDLF